MANRTENKITTKKKTIANTPDNQLNWKLASYLRIYQRTIVWLTVYRIVVGCGWQVASTESH